jgi:hypothetical protein
MEFEVTEHFRERSIGRGLKPEVLNFVLVWGTSIRAAGARHLVVLNKELPVEVQGDPIAKVATQWVLVLSPDGRTLVTCFRNDEAHKFVKTKSKDIKDHRARTRKVPRGSKSSTRCYY